MPKRLDCIYLFSYQPRTWATKAALVDAERRNLSRIYEKNQEAVTLLVFNLVFRPLRVLFSRDADYNSIVRINLPDQLRGELISGSQRLQTN